MKEALKTAQRSLCIQLVNLKQSKVFVGDEIDLPLIDRSKTVVQSFRSVSQIRITSLTDDSNNDEWDYRFVYSIGMRLVFESDIEIVSNEDFKPPVEIVGIFEAKYLSKNELSEEETKEFSKDSVGYHVWPYWREYVQSSCTRVGLTPVLEVPVYFMPFNNKEACSDSPPISQTLS